MSRSKMGQLELLDMYFGQIEGFVSRFFDSKVAVSNRLSIRVGERNQLGDEMMLYID